MKEAKTTKKPRSPVIQVVLDHATYQQLLALKDAQGRSESNAGAYLIAEGLKATTTTACVNNTRASA